MLPNVIHYWLILSCNGNVLYKTWWIINHREWWDIHITNTNMLNVKVVFVISVIIWSSFCQRVVWQHNRMVVRDRKMQSEAEGNRFVYLFVWLVVCFFLIGNPIIFFGLDGRALYKWTYVTASRKKCLFHLSISYTWNAQAQTKWKLAPILLLLLKWREFNSMNIVIRLCHDNRRYFRVGWEQLKAFVSRDHHCHFV